MSKYIRNIGKCRYNGLGCDLYENKDSSATLRFSKNANMFHHKTSQKFDSLSDAEDYIERNEGSSGLNTLINILNLNDEIR